MDDFFITLFLGWAGVHKMIKGQVGIGLLYFFTFGLFGIGWLIDIINAFPKKTHNNGKISNKEESISQPHHDFDSDYDEDEEEEKDPNRINFSVAGVSFNNEDGTSRQEILKEFYEKRGYSKKDIVLQRYEHEGKDALHVVAKGKIIGNVPKEYVQILIDNLDTLRIYHFRVKQNKKGIYYSLIDLFLK